MGKLVLAVALTAVLAASLAPPMLGQSESGETDRARDPVCNLIVKKDPELSVRHNGQIYYFCMKKDMEAFQRNPDRYLGNTRHDHPEPNR